MLRSTQDVEMNVDVDFDDYHSDQENQKYLEIFVWKYLPYWDTYLHISALFQVLLLDLMCQKKIHRNPKKWRKLLNIIRRETKKMKGNWNTLFWNTYADIYLLYSYGQ